MGRVGLLWAQGLKRAGRASLRDAGVPDPLDGGLRRAPWAFS